MVTASSSRDNEAERRTSPTSMTVAETTEPSPSEMRAAVAARRAGASSKSRRMVEGDNMESGSDVSTNDANCPSQLRACEPLAVVRAD